MKVTTLLLLGAAVTVTACDKAEPSRRAASRPIDVQIAAARVIDLPRVFEAGGSVRARTTATLVSRIVAPVQQVLAQPGDRVKAGQTLIRLDARESQANRAQAEAAVAAAEQGVRSATTAREGAAAGLALAAATHKRIAELRAKNSATAHELDQAVGGLRGAEAQAQGAQAAIHQAEAATEAARAALRGAAVAVSYASITAPFDGVVTEKLVEPGNMAAPGVPLMTIEDTRGFRLEVKVDEARVAAIDRAMPVEVALDSADLSAGQGRGLNGRITEVSRALDPGSHSFLVKVDLPEGAGLQSGLFGRARFAGTAKPALVVPAASVVRRGQLVAVFVVGADNRASLRLLNAGDSFGGNLEVAAGLEAGERVVVDPPPSLVDGTPVREVRR
jgi:RND family efflux transporter MFP subunit